MRRSRLGTYIGLGFAALVAALPHAASAALFSGPIIPQSGSCLCAGSAPDWGCVLQVLQNVIQFAVYLGVILCVVWIAYGGFAMMVSGGSAEARSQARTRVTNAIVGILVILCSWIIVDFVMKTLYDPESAFSGQNFGPWNSILASNGHDFCIQATTPQTITSGTVGIVFGQPAGGTSSGGAAGTAGPICADGNSACSVSALKNAGLSEGQARAMSCIAVTESSGNPHGPNSSTGACGTFQITTRPGNWSKSQFHSPPCSSSTSCNDASCNLQTAVIMFQQQGYQPWTCRNCNNKAAACVAKYDPGA